MNYTDHCSGSQMFLAPTVHPTHTQSTFGVEFAEGNVSDTSVPNQAFLLQCAFISDLNQGAALCVEVIEAYVCIIFCCSDLAVKAKASGRRVVRKNQQE